MRTCFTLAASIAATFFRNTFSTESSVRASILPLIQSTSSIRSLKTHSFNSQHNPRTTDCTVHCNGLLSPSHLLALPQKVTLLMKVTQAVFGVFHHFELAHQLHRRNHLEKIYSTWPWARLKREGLPRSLVSTFPLLHTTDYLLNRTGLHSQRLSAKLNARTALSFDRWTAR